MQVKNVFFVRILDKLLRFNPHDHCIVLKGGSMKQVFSTTSL